MADLLIFEPLQDAAFKILLAKAFKSFPKRVEQILAREGWTHYKDFMAAVERSGRLFFQFEGEAKAKLLQERGSPASDEEMYGIFNTDAMNQLLSGAFFGIQKGEVDRDLSAQALSELDIVTWKQFSVSVLALAYSTFEEMTGEAPLRFANADTLLFQSLLESEVPTPEVMNKVMKVFGAPTDRHLIAISSALLAGELSVEDLNRAAGNPELMTELVNRSPSNPHKGIVFSEVDNPMSLGYAGA